MFLYRWISIPWKRQPTVIHALQLVDLGRCRVPPVVVAFVPELLVVPGLDDVVVEPEGALEAIWRISILAENLFRYFFPSRFGQFSIPKQSRQVYLTVIAKFVV
jgi:hypothetical protein